MGNSESADQQTIWSIFQTTANMRHSGLSDAEIRKRLIEVGLQPDTAEGAIAGVPTFLSKTRGRGRVAGPPKVFLSHSHRDRDTAAYLQSTLQENDVLTYLDQHQLVPGQNLDDRLTLGLLWCDHLLLCWSTHAVSSKFVQWEWKRARRLSKSIIPYLLDSTPLPRKLAGTVYIDESDQQRGHAELLRTVLGRTWKPQDTAALFPGNWIAELNLLGTGEAEYHLQLRANGQIVGEGGIKASGVLEALAGDQVKLLTMRIPVTGSWSYFDREKILRMELTGTLMGQMNRDTVRIHTTGKEKGWLRGETLGGLPWRLRRVG